MQITQQLLQELSWRDFSLMPYQGHLVLVLLYEESSKAERFLELLHTNEFNVRFLSEAGTRKHIIEIVFVLNNLVIRGVFNKTEETYPVKSRLHIGVNHITTGIRTTGGQILFNNVNMKSIDLSHGSN